MLPKAFADPIDAVELGMCSFRISNCGEILYVIQVLACTVIDKHT